MFGTKKKKLTKKAKSSTKRLTWHSDNELTERVRGVITEIGFLHIQTHRIFCFRTEGSKSRAYARIWAFPKIFQNVLEIEPAYVIEVINKYYDKLSYEEQTKVLIHELLHIPKNFSGSLLPHKYGNTQIEKEVEKIYKTLR
ncbi:MAG: metallopeptidase [Candidatus Levybacteria bacterium]|nr:metallopeptidase [Candidatus Levybacteria bacterium]MBP9815432.1 metallopeptidase [Candidatus Levybacteria bacterium]